MMIYLLIKNYHEQRADTYVCIQCTGTWTKAWHLFIIILLSMKSSVDLDFLPLTVFERFLGGT